MNTEGPFSLFCVFSQNLFAYRIFYASSTRDYLQGCWLRKLVEQLARSGVPLLYIPANSVNFLLAMKIAIRQDQ